VTTVQRLSVWLLALLLLALPIVAVMHGWIGSQHWPLRTLQVQGTFSHVSDEQIRQALLPYTHEGFLALRLTQVQQALEELPWVQRTQVRRQWPDTLLVTIVEHVPLAWWGNGRMVTVQGQLFPPPEGLETWVLPWLEGNDTQAHEVIALYQHAQSIFVPWGLNVQRVRLDNRNSASLVLNNGMYIILGRQHIQARLQRLEQVLPQLSELTDTYVRIDLRYPNGFAMSTYSPTGER